MNIYINIYVYIYTHNITVSGVPHQRVRAKGVRTRCSSGGGAPRMPSRQVPMPKEMYLENTCNVGPPSCKLMYKPHIID